MTDRRKVYKKVLKMLKKMMPTARQNDVVLLAMMIVGIVLGKKAQLSEMSLYAPPRPNQIASTSVFGGGSKRKRIGHLSCAWHLVSSSPKEKNKQALPTFCLSKRKRRVAQGVFFTNKLFGPVTIVAGWKKPYKKPLYLVSNHPETKMLPRFYAKRFKIETFFI